MAGAEAVAEEAGSLLDVNEKRHWSSGGDTDRKVAVVVIIK